MRFPPPTHLVVCCHSRQQAEQVKARLAGWLAPRGLAFNEAKTRIVHLSEGFDFLGFSLRRYPNGKLLIKPGATAIKRFRKRLAGEFRALRGANAAATGAFLPKLSWTPIVRHTLVMGGASPDDPSLAQYWERRRQKVKPPLDPSVVRLLSRPKFPLGAGP